MKLTELETALDIDKYKLDDELVKQPTLYYKISDMHAKACANRDTLKFELEELENKLYVSIREENESQGNKITEAAIKARIATTPAYKKIATNYRQAKIEAEMLLPLKSAYEQRSHALRDLTNLYASNYFQVESISKPRNEAVTRIAEKARKQRSKQYA